MAERGGFTQRVLALRPSGCLRQFKIAPGDFMNPFWKSGLLDLTLSAINKKAHILRI